MKKHSQEKARSMVEMIGVLAIVGILSVVAISGYGKAMAKFKINAFIDQISHIQMNVVHLLSRTGNYEGLTNQISIQIGIFEDSMLDTGNRETAKKAYHLFNGEIKVREGSTNDSYFTIEVKNLPKQVCIEWLIAEGSRPQNSIWVASRARNIKPPYEIEDILKMCDQEINEIHIGYEGAYTGNNTEI